VIFTSHPIYTVEDRILGSQFLHAISEFFFFFFSSRRRHTRSLRDWSSDVCSSDLPIRGLQQDLDGIERIGDADRLVPLLERVARSEERRVGKECRSRWSRYQ